MTTQTAAAERLAQLAYEALLHTEGLHTRAPRWEALPEYAKQTWRAVADAVAAGIAMEAG